MSKRMRFVRTVAGLAAVLALGLTAPRPAMADTTPTVTLGNVQRVSPKIAAKPSKTQTETDDLSSIAKANLGYHVQGMSEKLGSASLKPALYMSDSSVSVSFSVTNPAKRTEYTMSVQYIKKPWNRKTITVKQNENQTLKDVVREDGILLRVRFKATKTAANGNTETSQTRVLQYYLDTAKRTLNLVYVNDVPWIRQDSGLFNEKTMGWTNTWLPTMSVRNGIPLHQCGCGFCAVSMALSASTGRTVLPDEVVKASGVIINGAGEYQTDCTEVVAKSFGVKAKPTQARSDVDAALKNGSTVVVLLPAGLAPNGRPTNGHYILLYGYDAATKRYLIADSGGYPLGHEDCLSLVKASQRKSSRTYIPSSFTGYFRQTFTWNEAALRHIGPYWIFPK